MIFELLTVVSIIKELRALERAHLLHKNFEESLILKINNITEVSLSTFCSMLKESIH